MIKRAIQSVSGQTRVLLSALEEKWGCSMPYDHPLICYIVEYAGVLLNRFEVGVDGRTAYERNKGSKVTTLGIGEAVLWRRKKVGGAIGKLTSLWEDGIFLGVMGKSGELIVGDVMGVWKTRTVHRKPHSERWDPKTIDLVRHPPWRTCDDDPNADGEMPQGVKLETLTGHKFQEIVEDEQSMPRRVYLNKNDFEEHGYSSGCPGCRSILEGIRRQGHSEACRQRIQKALEGTERLERARTREKRILRGGFETRGQEAKACRETSKRSG